MKIYSFYLAKALTLMITELNQTGLLQLKQIQHLRIEFFHKIQYNKKTQTMSWHISSESVHRNNSSNKQNCIKQTYIMLRGPLQKCYNAEQWKQISQQPVQKYRSLQQKILTNLLHCEELFNKYFHIFYNNHVRLYHWYLLARENHYDIKLYLNKKLLKKNIEKYKDQMKGIQMKILREKEKEKEDRAREKFREDSMDEQNIKVNRYRIEDLSHEIFNFMATKTKTASLMVEEKPWSFNRTKKFAKDNTVPNQTRNSNLGSKWAQLTKSSSPTRKQELLKKLDSSLRTHDFHELYIETFHACDGPRYIFYNYEKHMKGLSEKDKYNMFIRNQNKTNKYLDIRLTQISQDQPTFKEMKNCDQDQDQLKSSYEYSSFGNAVSVDDRYRKDKIKTSQVVFRRTRTRNIGKFIRK